MTLSEGIAALQDPQALDLQTHEDRSVLAPLIGFLSASGRGIVR